MSTSSGSWPDMPDEVQSTLRTYLEQLRKQVGDPLKSVILFGSLARGEFIPDRSNINLLLILSEISLRISQKVGQLHNRWGKRGIVVPLIMSGEELRTSIDLFPLEYFEIKHHHVLLEGRDPFPELHIQEDRLIAQCQQELMSNLIRVRQRFIEGEGRAEAIQALLPLSLTALLPCLHALLHVLGHTTKGKAAAILELLPSAFQVDQAVFQEVLNVKRGTSSPGSMEFPRLFERYLQAFQHLIERVRELKIGDGQS